MIPKTTAFRIDTEMQHWKLYTYRLRTDYVFCNTLTTAERRSYLLITCGIYNISNIRIRIRIHGSSCTDIRISIRIRGYPFFDICMCIRFRGSSCTDICIFIRIRGSRNFGIWYISKFYTHQSYWDVFMVKESWRRIATYRAASILRCSHL